MIDIGTRTVGVVSLATPYFDLALANANLAATRTVLADRYRVVGPDAVVVEPADADAAITQLAAAGVDALVLQAGTFPDGEVPVRLAMALHVPIVVHGIAEPAPRERIALNSLCGVNATTFALSALDHPHAYVVGTPTDPRLVDAVDAALTAAALRGARIGVYGSHPQGFYPSGYDEVGLLRQFGLLVEHISMHGLYPGEARKPAPTPLRHKDGTVVAAERQRELEARYAAAAASFAEHGHVDAITLKDWPELWGMWPVVGWLQDDGYVVAVEGDFHASLTMLTQHTFSRGGTQMLCDLSAVDDAESTLTVWHHGVATSLATEPDAVVHDENAEIVEFPIRPGRATLARIGGHRGGYRIITVDVQITDEPVRLGRAAGLARTLRTPAGEVVDTMLDQGWDHHLVLCYGDWSARWRYFAKIAGVPLVAL